MTDKMREVIRTLKYAMDWQKEYHNGFPRHVDMEHNIEELLAAYNLREQEIQRLRDALSLSDYKINELLEFDILSAWDREEFRRVSIFNKQALQETTTEG